MRIINTLDAAILDDQESNNRGVSIVSNNQGASYRVEQSGGRRWSGCFAVFLCIVQNVFESSVQGKGRNNGCVHAVRKSKPTRVKSG